MLRKLWYKLTGKCNCKFTIATTVGSFCDTCGALWITKDESDMLTDVGRQALSGFKQNKGLIDGEKE